MAGGWTEAEVDYLRAKAKDGWTSGRIAEGLQVFRQGRSRSAVVGACLRLGIQLQGRVVDPNALEAARRKAAPAPAPPPLAARPPAELPVATPNANARARANNIEAAKLQARGATVPVLVAAPPPFALLASVGDHFGCPPRRADRQQLQVPGRRRNRGGAALLRLRARDARQPQHLLRRPPALRLQRKGGGMKHAIRRLQEEKLALEEAAETVEADPTGEAGSLEAAIALLAEIHEEIAEVVQALNVLGLGLSCLEAAPRREDASPLRSIRTTRGRSLKPVEARLHA